MDIGSIAAGWQAGIGDVVAGSLFATLQSLTMTGVLTSIGGWTIGAGVLRFLASWDWGSAIAMLVRRGLGERKKISHGAIRAAISRFYEVKRTLDAAIASASASETEIAKFLKDLHDASEVLATLGIAKSELDLDKAASGTSEDRESDGRSITNPYTRRRGLQKRLDAALATMTSASEEDIRQIMEELKEVDSEIAGARLPQSGVPPASFEDKSDKSNSKLDKVCTTSPSTPNDKMIQLMKDLHYANDEIAALKLALADTSRLSPSDDNERITSSTTAPSAVNIAPLCPTNGYNRVAAEYKGPLAKNPRLRIRLQREGRCFFCRQPGAPHTLKSRGSRRTTLA